MRQLFFVNLPHNCTDREFQEWIESRGIKTASIRIIRDLVYGGSPAFGYAELVNPADVEDAAAVLHGKRMRNQIVMVSPSRGCPVLSFEEKQAV